MPYIPPAPDAVDFSGPAGPAVSPAPDAVDFPPAGSMPTFVSALPLAVRSIQPFRGALPLSVTISDPRVFDTALGRVAWSMRVIVNGIDISSRLTDQTRIEAAEDAARIAELTFVPVDQAMLAGTRAGQVSIDVLVAGGGYSACVRRFTGVVEQHDYDPVERVVVLACRDGYQERIAACGDAAAVMALLPGALVSPLLVEWDDVAGAADYFSSALETLPGATYIDGHGLWRAVPWSIGSPARVYSAGDMYDPGPSVSWARRADLPSAVVATLKLTFPRLHNKSFGLAFQMVDYQDIQHKGLNFPLKSEVMSALEKLPGWHVLGSPTFTEPVIGEHPFIVGEDTVHLTITDEQAALSVDAFQCVLYHRWYQMVERIYTVKIDLGGSSDRDDSVSHAVTVDFDADAWESGRSASSPLGIYSKNPPPGAEDAPEMTGYEALEQPWPPGNGAMDHFGDLTPDDIETAMAHVVAIATRKAAGGRRKQIVPIERPVDLRNDIGTVVGIDAFGVSTVGQLSSFVETFDHTTGEMLGQYEFACPDGDSTSTASTVNVTFNDPDVEHEPAGAALQVWIGADVDTPRTWINPDNLIGFLVNTAFYSEDYDETAPMYERQFRIPTPGIDAVWRDPIEESVVVDAVVQIAGQGIAIDLEG